MECLASVGAARLLDLDSEHAVNSLPSDSERESELVQVNDRSYVVNSQAKGSPSFFHSFVVKSILSVFLVMKWTRLHHDWRSESEEGVVRCTEQAVEFAVSMKASLKQIVEHSDWVCKHSE